MLKMQVHNQKATKNNKNYSSKKVSSAQVIVRFNKKYKIP